MVDDGVFAADVQHLERAIVSGLPAKLNLDIVAVQKWRSRRKAGSRH